VSTFSQNRQFINDVIERDLLETAVEWISKNMEVTEVFSESDLEYWALNNGYKKEEES
jgi:hypothetical protein